jgi:hypothetical protein
MLRTSIIRPLVKGWTAPSIRCFPRYHFATPTLTSLPSLCGRLSPAKARYPDIRARGVHKNASSEVCPETATAVTALVLQVDFNWSGPSPPRQGHNPLNASLEPLAQQVKNTTAASVCLFAHKLQTSKRTGDHLIFCHEAESLFLTLW